MAGCVTPTEPTHPFQGHLPSAASASKLPEVTSTNFSALEELSQSLVEAARAAKGGLGCQGAPGGAGSFSSGPGRGSFGSGREGGRRGLQLKRLRSCAHSSPCPRALPLTSFCPLHGRGADGPLSAALLGLRQLLLLLLLLLLFLQGLETQLLLLGNQLLGALLQQRGTRLASEGSLGDSPTL